MPSPPATLPTTTARVAVVGASGFVGGAVATALVARGHQVLPIRAPRLAPAAPKDLAGAVDARQDAVSELATRLEDCDAMVNAAGLSTSGSGDLAGMLAANAVLPAVIAGAAERAAVTRVVHVSSGAAQGAAPVLDATPRLRPFSPYSYSKAVGEQLVLAAGRHTVVYRPAGVQGAERPATRRLVQAARSPAALVAGDGDGNSPQALVENIADAAAFLATTELPVPRIVHHPSEGITVSELLELLGGRPRHVPRPLAIAAVRTLQHAGRLLPPLTARRRRLEVMWFGQRQAPSWLATAGWSPVAGRAGWQALGAALAS